MVFNIICFFSFILQHYLFIISYWYTSKHLKCNAFVFVLITALYTPIRYSRNIILDLKIGSRSVLTAALSPNCPFSFIFGETKHNNLPGLHLGVPQLPKSFGNPNELIYKFLLSHSSSFIFADLRWMLVQLMFLDNANPLHWKNNWKVCILRKMFRSFRRIIGHCFVTVNETVWYGK